MIDNPFRSMIRAEGVRLYRDLPWRRTRDPYVIWLSEVMLQQTQVPRVLDRMPAWLERFPSVAHLAQAPTADVLAAWQGMGYNRRALSLHAAARMLMDDFDGVFPQDAKELQSLPGVGPATAQGIRSFAFDLPGVYLETNVRTVFLHHYFPDAEGVSDKELVPLVEAACPDAPGAAEPGVYAQPMDAKDTPRAWYYALLDYGAYLKKSVPNPSRRSRGYAKQSKFEGSRRQKRAELVRALLARHDEGLDGLLLAEAVEHLNAVEAAAGRKSVDETLVRDILNALVNEGFCVYRDGCWFIA